MTDQQIIEKALAGAPKPGLSSPSGARVAIYGAGGKARSLAASLLSSGASVAAFIDKNAPSIDARGLPAPLLTPESWDSSPLAVDAIAIGIHNYATDLSPIFAWAKSRFSVSLAIPDLLDIMPHWSGPHYFSAPRAVILNAAPDLTRGLSRMRDELSRRSYLDAINHRLVGNGSRLVEPNLMDQYAPNTLASLGIPLRVVDCGAFNGDSLQKIARREQVEGVIAFEPDPAPLEALRRVCLSLAPSSQIEQAGVWSRDCSLRFDPIGPGSGTFSENSLLNGGEPNAFSLDSLWKSNRLSIAPNFIKMDIEGAELPALEGARELLRAYRPALALSCYHRPEDLWALSDWIENQDLGYQFNCRSHGHSGFDLVLYARVE